jgi:hypothetical protein
MFEYITLVLVYFAVLTAINMRQLSQQDESTESAAILLGVDSLAQATPAHIHALGGADSVARCFRALGRESSPVGPSGEYKGVSLWGVTNLAGAHLIVDHLMGFDGHGTWTGKFFDHSDQSAGLDTFVDRAQFASRARPYTVVRGTPSAFDDQPTTLLDYSSTDLGWLTVKRDEIRCVHSDLCIGFGGLALAGGVRNGSPFFLHRRAAHPSKQAGGQAGGSGAGAGSEL